MNEKINFIVLSNFSSSTACSPADKWLITAKRLPCNQLSPTTTKPNPLTIRQIVINSIILPTQLTKEQPRKITNPLILIIHALGHLTQLALHLHHPIQNQMRQHHQRVLLHRQTPIAQSAVQVSGILVNHRVERDCNVPECNDDVAPDVGVLGCFEDLEQQSVVVVAEFGADAEELAERERSRSAERRILQKII